MKKLLFIGMMCAMSIGAFANKGSNASKYVVPTETIENHNLKGVVSEVRTETNFFCTVTVTIAWYNEWGGFEGYSTGTASQDGPFGCTIARMLAESRAEQAF